ncbi:MAG TPA: serine hydrolase [Kofleriaceae bacterium]|nr:serine hydrolase [Kofleriaceae bacterium]
MRARRVALPFLLVLVAVACVRCSSPWTAPVPPASPIDEDMPVPPPTTQPFSVTEPPRSLEELRARLQAIIQRDRIAGAAIALIDRNGPIWVGGLGVRDRASRAPVDGDTVFRVGSLSKSVIALGVMRLVDQGKLDVDRPLREILPDLAIDNPWEAEAPVTLAQCLEHTAGFDDVRFNEIFAPDEAMSVRDTLALSPRSRTIRWKPGTRHEYSNVGYTVAALAIEVAAGESFDAYLRREILAPMGITDADFQRTSTLTPRLATGYMDVDRPVVFRPFAHRPAGALLASASDLGKLVHFWIMRGEGYPPIVSQAGLARIERSGTLPYPHVDAEYGFANYSDVMSPVIGRGHDGGMPGFHSSYRYFPSLGVGYAMLLNSTYTFRGYFELRALLFAYLTQGRTFAPPATMASASELPGARYFMLGGPGKGPFGFIDKLWQGWRVTPMAHGELAISDLQGEQSRLIPTPDGGYRHPGNCGSSVRFTTSADGRPLMLLGWNYTEAGSEWFGRSRLAAFRLATTMLLLAPFWALLELVLAFMWRRRILPRSLILWPATAGVCCYAMPHLLERAFFSGVIGTVHPLTVGLCGVTIVLAVASVATLVCAVRWLRRADRPPVVALILPLTFGVAFTAFSLWLGLNGVIGLRTWAW